MFKKTLLILAIICLVFSQTFACKKKMKGAWKKVKNKGSECLGCLKRPNSIRKPLLSPSPSVASSSGSYHSAYGDPVMLGILLHHLKVQRHFFWGYCISKLIKYISRLQETNVPVIILWEHQKKQDLKGQVSVIFFLKID